jgi:hypothetical protein
MRPFWRLSLSLNDEPENLMILPPLDPSITDKIILLKCAKNPMPMPSGNACDRTKFWRAIQLEIPAFLHTVESFEISLDMQDNRMGVRAYQHPELETEIRRLDPENILLELIDLHLWKTIIPDEWEGTAHELQSTIEAENPYTRLFRYNTACGTYLSKLATSRPLRVQKLKTVNGYQRWCVRKDKHAE